MSQERNRMEVSRLTEAIAHASARLGRPVRLMEVCGTHTVAIFRHGIRSLLPEGIGLLSGPGCPVCVTSIQDVDVAVALARTPGVVLTTFGDMVRVPGSRESLSQAQGSGASVRIVYGPMDALALARENADKKVVFFAAGFETTSPLVAATLMQAEATGVANFYLHVVHKLVPPALSALLDAPDVGIDGFILPGHVSAILGTEPYSFLADRYKVPSAITGFDAHDILEGILMVLEGMINDNPQVRIQYARVVRPEGNPKAREALARVFVPCDAYWRGIGLIPQSGYALKRELAHRDIGAFFDVGSITPATEPAACRCGQVLRGIITPAQCPLFGKACTPERPVGACMVSTEGSCAAHYKYGGI